MRKIEEVLPIFGVEHDAILSKMGDITIGFRVQLPEIFSLGAQDYEAFHQAWIKAIRLLSANTVIHKQDWFTEAKYKADFSREHSFLSRSSERFFNERPYLDHNCYLYLTKKPADRTIATSAFSSLLRKHIVPVETLDEKNFADFSGVAGQFERVLCDSGFVSMERLNDEALLKTVFSYLNLGNDNIVRDISFKEGIQVGEKHCELFTLADAVDLPSFCGSRITLDKYSTDKTKFSTGFASSIGQLLSCNHIYNQYLCIVEQPAAIKKLESRKLRLQSLSAYSRDNSIARDATDAFLQEAVGGQKQIVKAHFNILAWIEKKENLRELRNQCAAALSQMDATPKIETVGAPQIFWAGIPGNAADLPVNETFDTFSAQACCFFNLETNYLPSISPIGLRLGDRITGRPLHVDISDEPMQKGWITNRNKLIIGPSGSGKSFLDNHMSRSYYERDTHIVIVDSGHSYQGLCELLNGTYLAYTEEQPLSTNPFHIGIHEVLDTEKKESLKTLLIALWKQDDQSFNRSEYVALSNALQLFYQKEIPFRCFNSFYEFLETDFVELLKTHAVKEKDFDVSNFLYVLRPFYKGGEFDYLLNATEHLDLLNERFIVFELDAIKDHPILFPVVTIILMDVFIAKMRKLGGVRKILLLEEVWKSLTKSNMESAIQYWVKTIRKYFGELWPVSQEIEDMIGSSVVKNAIINNCDTKILLDQSKYQNRFEEVQALLGLSDKERMLALSVNKANDPSLRYKEVFISLGGHAKVYRVETSNEEYYAYTTEQTEKVSVQAAAKRYGSMEKGIQSLLVSLFFLFCSCAYAQIPIIGAIIGKVVKAIDLKVQKLQNETLVLQNAQKTIENDLHKIKLQELSDWSEKQKDLYRDYFNELQVVKTAISQNASMEAILKLQQQLTEEYKHGIAFAKSHVTSKEFTTLDTRYNQIITQSSNALDQLSIVTTNNSVSMDDAGRLQIIKHAETVVKQSLHDIQKLNQKVALIINERMKAKNNIAITKKLYGLP